MRKVTKISQTLPKNYLDEIRTFLFNAIKDMIEYDTETSSNIIANVDETAIFLEPITTTTLEKIGLTTVKIHSFGRHKQRISCLLCILGKGYKLVPTLVFKGVKDGTLEKRLKNYPEVKKGNTNIKCQINSCVNKYIYLLNG